MAVFYDLKRRYLAYRFGRENSAGQLQKALYLPRACERVMDTEFLAVDCEMSGLDTKSDQLLSIGWVPIYQGRVVLAGAEHHYIDSNASVAKTATIHGILHRDLEGAEPIQKVLQRFISAAANKVLVFHFSTLDIAFIQKAVADFGFKPLKLSYIDTLQIERRRLQIAGREGAVHLSDCRQRYNLPTMLEHHALMDARATAELLLAQVASLGAPKLRLRNLGIRCFC